MKYAKSIARSFPAARRKLYLAIAAQMLFAAGANASPTGGVVVAGEGQIDQSGLDTTIIQNTDRMAVDWTSFNIQADERVQFIQPSETSVALNRILGSEASQIFGRLDANGHVILMNPNGVFFGEGATVNVGGLVASGLAINPDEFMNGDFALNAVEGMDGTVINQGIINAAAGGNVALVGQRVENQGLISAKLGSVTLAAGKEAVLTFDNQGLLGVHVTQEILQNELGVESAVSNTGEINAEGGRILLTGSVSQDIFSRAVNSEGLNAKTSVVMHDDGSFTLGAGADVVNTGTLNAGTSDNTTAGHIVVLGENINHSGAILANNTHSGQAGNIELHSSNTTLLTGTSTLNASASSQGKGGDIKVLGDRVGVFDQSSMDAAGVNGGGDIYIGGGFQGKNPHLRNATRTVVGKDTVINADALQNGNGGEVIVWADQTTSFTGEISVRGGAHGGDGGFVEVSGKENLRFDGGVDRAAVEGKSGTLLLDPETIEITNIGTGNNTEIADGVILFDDVIDGGLIITADALANAIEDGDVILQASSTIIANDQVIVRPGAFSGGNSNALIMEAGGGINLLKGSSFDLDAGDLILSAGLANCGVAVCNNSEQQGVQIGTFLGTDGLDSVITSGKILVRSAYDISVHGSIRGGSIELEALGSVNLGYVLPGGSDVFQIESTDSPGPGIRFSAGLTESISNGTVTTSSNTSYQLPALAEIVPTDASVQINFGATPDIIEIVTNGADLRIDSLGGIESFGTLNSLDLSGLNGPGNLTVISQAGNIDFNTFSSISVGNEFDTGALTITAQTPGQLNLPSFTAASETIAINFSLQAGSIDIQEQLITNGGNFSANAGSFVFANEVGINTAGLSDQSAGNIDLVSQQDIRVPTIVSGGNLTIESVLGNIRSSSALNVAGDTMIVAAENINLGEGFLLESSSGNAAFSAGQSLGLYQFFLGVPVINVGGDLSLNSGDGPVSLTGIYNARSFDIGSLGGGMFGEQVEINSETDVDINLPNGVFDFTAGDMLVNTGSFSATAQGLQIGGVTINTDSGKGTGDVTLIATGSDAEYDVWMPTIVSDGDLNVEAQEGSVTIRESLSVAGETRIKAGQDINLSGDTIFNPEGDVYFNAGRIIRVERSAAEVEFGEPLPYIKLASDNTSSFFWEAGSGIIIYDLELGQGDFIASANNGMQIERLHAGGKVLLRSVGEINWKQGVLREEELDPMDELQIYSDERVYMPAMLDIEGNFTLHAYSGAANILANTSLNTGNGNTVLLPELSATKTLEHDGRVDWWSNGTGFMFTNGGGFFIRANLIDSFGAATIDTSSADGHGDITLIARDYIQVPRILYSTAITTPVAQNSKINIQAGRILLDRDFNFNNGMVVEFNLVSDSDLILGVVRGDEHDLSEDDILIPDEFAEGNFFDSAGGDGDHLNLEITAGGTVFQKYDIFTGGGNYTANASEFIFNESVQINTDFSSTTQDALSGNGNVSIRTSTSQVDLLLPSIVTQSNCVDSSSCGTLDVKGTNVDNKGNIRVFGDAAFDVTGALRIDNSHLLESGQILSLVNQFGGRLSVNADFARFNSTDSANLGEWNLTSTTEYSLIVMEGVENRTSIIGYEPLKIAADFILASDYVELANAESKFSNLLFSANSVNIEYSGDLNLGGAYLFGGSNEEVSRFRVLGDLTFSGYITGEFLSMMPILEVAPAAPIVFDVAGNLRLVGENNRLSSIQIINSQAVEIINNGDLAFDGAVAKDLSLTVSGNVTQTGAINVSGESLFNLSGLGGLTLENAANNFNEVSINSSSTNASRITDSDNLLLGNINASSNIQIISQGDGALVSQKAASQIILSPGGLMSISADNIHLGESASSIQMDGGSLTLTAEQSLNFSGAISGIGATPSRLTASVTDATGAELNINPTATFAGFDADTSLISLSDGNDVINVASNAPFYIEAGLGDDTFNVLAEGLSILNLNGNEGIDALVGADGDNDWEIGAVNEGQLTSAGSVTGFFEIENLIGGAGSDSYSFTNPQFDGMFFNGGAGVNSLSIFSNQALEWQLNADGGQLNLPESQVSGSFANIQTLTTFDPSTFFINDLNTTVTDIQGSAQSGYTFDFSNITDAFSLDLKAFPFVLQGIEYFHVVGNGALSSLTGTDQNNLWVLSDTGIALWTNADFESAARLEPAFATFQNFAKLEGGAADNDFVVESENLEIALVGSDDDRLFGNNHDASVNNIWTINGIYSGSLNGNILFDNICTLQGNAGDDTFTFAADSIIKNINADAGDDTFILASNISAELLDGGEGQDTINRNGLNAIYTYLNQLLSGDATYTTANIEVETNVGGSTTVVAVDGYDAEWTIDGEGSVLVTATDAGGVSVNNRFTSVTRLEGGSGDDAFILLPGGAIADGILGSGDDSLRAGDTTNTWTINAANGGELAVQEDGTSLLFEGIANLIGGAGSDLFDIATGGSISGSIDGGAGTDRLQISDAAAINNWQLGLQNSLGLVNQFRGIETLVGNANNDIFTFAAVSDVKKIEGRGGNNTLDWHADEVVINLCGCVESNDVEFSGINNFIADAAFNNTIIGLNEQNTWTLTGADSGTVNAVNFAGFKILQGGTAEDVLVGFDEAQTWQIGEQGENTLSTLDKQITFRGMESLLGGAGEDAFYVDTSVAPVSLSLDGGGGVNVLYGNTNNSVDNDWTIDGIHAGTLNEGVSFANIQILEGNDSNDTFTFAANSVIGRIHAGAGDDTFILANSITADLLDGADGTDTMITGALKSTITYLGEIIDGGATINLRNGIEVVEAAGEHRALVGVDGYSAQWTITGEGDVSVTATGSDGVAITNQFVLIARAEGGSGTDAFVLLAGGALTEGIAGDGNDSLQASDTTNTWTINVANSGELAVQENGTTLLFEGIANLIGGTGSDIFDIVTGGSISGSIDGGAGVDTLRISDTAAVNNWQLATRNTVEMVNQFLGIETLVGNANNDHFIIGGTTDVVAIDGGAGANRLTAFDQTNSWSLTADNAGSVTGLTSFNNIQTLVGGAGVDTFTLGSGSSIAEIYGGAGDDSFVIGRDVTANNIFGDAGDDSFDVDLGLILSGALDGGTGGEVAGDYLNLNKYTVLTASTDLEALLGFAFRNFERIDQPNNQGVYSGGDATNFWYITGENQGRLEIRDGANAGVYEFNDVHSLLGGSGEDVFIFANDAAAVTTIIDGGAGVGANTLDLSAQGLINQWLIEGTNSGRVSNDSNTTGNLFTNIAYLIGGGNRDNFSLQAGGAIAGGVDGGLGDDQLAIAAAQTSTWTLGGVSGHAVTGIASFENVESLVGSAGEDTFNVLSETLDVVRIDGAAGSDAINFQYANPVVVNLRDGSAGGLQVSAVERFIAGNTGSTLIAADTSNTWNLDGENSGSIRYLVDTGAEAINVAFDGFGNIEGGAADDQFTFQTGASFSGTFNAGAGTDRVSVQALTTDTHVTTDASVSLPTGVVGLRLQGIEQLLGNGRTWLYGASDQSYTWTISGQRSGQVTSTLVDADNQLLAFENLSAIVGGAHDDIFRVTVATPLLSLEGGAAVTSDLVDYSQVNGNLRINLATALSGQNGVLAGVEGIRGNNSGPDSVHTAELVAADGNNIWSIGTAGSALADGINDGEVTSAGQTIQFLDFNQLTGGAGVDSFTLAGGVLLGTVSGGAGNDVFDVTLAGANTGTLIDGGLGQDNLTLTGGDAAALMTYTAAANGGEFDYSLADIHFKLSHQAVETIRDNSRAQALEIRGSNLADTITLSNGGFQINGSDAIEHANKTRIAVRSGINDTIEIADHLVIAESLTLANGSVITNDPANSSISTAHLILDAARDVGLASARLRTSVDELSVRNSVGDIYLQEQNGLNLAEFTANGVFDLVLLNGDLTSSVPLTATDVFRVAANNGDITLRGANELRDDVALAGGRVELHNASTLTLVGVTAEDLILRTQRGIEGDGPLVVSGLTEIDAQGDVRLDFSTNDFNRVRVTNAWNLTLVDQNTLELLDINASGTVVVRSANTINVNDNIAGGVGVDVSSGSGSVNQNGSISTTNGSIVVEAGNGEVNFGDDARVVANGGSVNISAGSGNVNMGSDTRIAANGGNVNIEAAESVVVAEVVSSGNVAINAGSGSVSDGNGGATNIAAGGLQSSSNTGFGSEDALETQVGNIDVTTNTGNVGINNTGDVTVEAIRTEGGSIAVTNQGNVELTAGSVSAANGEVGSDVSLDVNLGSVKQSGPISVPAITGGVVLINAPQGSVAEGNLSVNADVVRITALSKAGEIFVNPGADKIEYFSGSFKFEDQLLSVEPLDDIDPAIFTNVRSYFYNDISLLLPSDQRYDEEEEEETEE